MLVLFLVECHHICAHLRSNWIHSERVKGKEKIDFDLEGVTWVVSLS